MSGTAAEPQLKTTSRAIPTRRVFLNDAAQLAGLDFSTTPGGTMFSTTPGGTRIVYERQFLLNCRNSPLTKSPPPNLPKIPGVTSPGSAGDISRENGNVIHEEEVTETHKDEPQFEMDI